MPTGIRPIIVNIHISWTGGNGDDLLEEIWGWQSKVEVVFTEEEMCIESKWM